MNHLSKILLLVLEEGLLHFDIVGLDVGTQDTMYAFVELRIILRLEHLAVDQVIPDIINREDLPLFASSSARLSSAGWRLPDTSVWV